MATTYKVVKDDTLWDIVQKPEYKNLIAGNTINAKVKTLVKLNNIQNPDYIVVGQTLKLSGSTTRAASTSSTAPVINVFGVRSEDTTGVYRTMYAGWTWSKTGTKGYNVKWTYKTKEGLWFTGNDESVGTDKASTYTAPNEAVEVRLRVRAEYTAENSYSDWSETKSHVFTDAPDPPPAPTVVIDGKKLTAWINSPTGSFGGTIAVFEIWRNNTTKWETSDDISITTGYASWIAFGDIAAGYSYKVRCKIVKIVGNNRVESAWSDYSEPIASAPTKPTNLTLSAKTKNNIRVSWKASTVKNASLKVLYEIQYIRYTDDLAGSSIPELFDSSSVQKGGETTEETYFEFDGLETGAMYYFRVRAASNAEGATTGGDVSDWSDIKSIILGEPPAAPTVWSSANTAIVGQPVYLYWVHNSKDGSSETYARLRHRISGGEPEIFEVKKNEAEGDKKDDTKVHEYMTDHFVEGAEVVWDVSTGGVTCDGVNDGWGAWSETRKFKVYTEPNLELNVTGNGIVVDKEEYDHPLLNHFPLQIHARNSVTDTIQKPVGYTIQIVSEEYHETINYRGEHVAIGEGEVVYSQYFDINTELKVNLSNIDLADGVTYSLICVMAMDSGLTSEAFFTFITNFAERIIDVSADIVLNEDAYSATIYPVARNEDGGRINTYKLAVYRREYDGRLTEIATNISNSKPVAVADPHPSLDAARYRIVAIDPLTSNVYCTDVTGPSFKNKPAIIQWDERWTDYETKTEEVEEITIDEDGNEKVVRSVVSIAEEARSWGGSIVKLPFNIDVHDTRKPEVSLIAYIGRENPVSYYGTQLNETASWNVAIRANDTQTIRDLRRLSKWTGDVYVREPSGTGYWANVQVSFPIEHNAVIIPVTINITRVEGGA